MTCNPGMSSVGSCLGVNAALIVDRRSWGSGKSCT